MSGARPSRRSAGSSRSSSTTCRGSAAPNPCVIGLHELPHPHHAWLHPSTVSWFAKYARSSIGAKQTMAVTGLLMLLFVIVHMLGHFQMFGGQDMYNK